MPTPAQVAVLPIEEAPLDVREVDLPDPNPSQVVVKQFASGICHSQLHQMRGPRRNPTLLGHESTGVVIQKGSDVSHVEEGDEVLVTWVPRNARQDPSRATPATLNLDSKTAVSQNVFTWASHTIADQRFVVKTEPMTDKHSTSIIGCAVMTGAGAVINTADVQAGESVAIFGVGGVGLSAVVAASVRGADPIIAVDLDEDKLTFAKKFGATIGINASKQDPVRAIHELTVNPNEVSIAGREVSGVDYAFDCIGLKTTMEQIVPAVRPGHFGARQGGTAVLVGVPHTTVELQAGEILGTEKQFRGSIGGSCSPDTDFPVFLDWHREGKLDLESLVTETYSLQDINEATAALAEGKIAGRSIIVF
ncbi:MAG: zinc-binding dehydrogenase [Gammaproteobacteria bacterium]|nr:zinc-binding dehydrogenase [Gammaproteobacteria bacterium]MYD81660.1 zinc-binding dehydrogenase [Gammaproteobacteria bacterium]